jgi:serine/threonine protein kinase
MWSVGVILYIMLCGYPPFYSETPSRNLTSEMKRKILSGKYEFPEEDWNVISDAAKDVVRRSAIYRMLEIEEKKKKFKDMFKVFKLYLIHK